MNCWEFMKCGPDVYEACPAYPDQGMLCWKKTGTKCGAGKVEKLSLAEKIGFCRDCEFYIKFAMKY